MAPAGEERFCIGADGVEQSRPTINVLVLTGDLADGFDRMNALRLVRELTPLGYHFTVLPLSGGGIGDELAAAGADVRRDVLCEVQDAGIVGSAGLAAALRGILQIAGLVRHARIDVVIVEEGNRAAMRLGLWGSLLGRLPSLRTRRVLWCRSIPSFRDRLITSIARYRRLGLITTIICTSMTQRGRLVSMGLPGRKIGLIRDGVDIEAIAASDGDGCGVAWPADKKLILHAADVTSSVDARTLLEAVAQLMAVRRDFHFVLAGRGARSPAFLSHVGSLGLLSAVTALGPCESPSPDVALDWTSLRQMLHRADLLILPTHGDASSGAVLEAMAAGVPVVVSDVPSFTEVMTHGREGLKVAPGDGDELADAISQLLNSPQLRARMGQAGRMTAQRFSSRRMADNFDRLLRTIVLGRRGRRLLRRSSQGPGAASVGPVAMPG